MKIRHILIALSLTPSLWASPVFFKCDEKGQMSEFLTGKEVLSGLQKMQALLGGNKQKLFEALCHGRTECEKTLSQVLSLTKISEETAKQERDELLKKLKGQMDLSPIMKVNQEAYDLEKSIRDAAADVAACRQTQVKLEPDQWEKNGCVSFYYPYKNEYTYASGFKFKDGKALSQGCASSDSLTKAIRKALIMGVDPAVYLSIGLMEGGFNGYEGLYLDPIGVMRALGCPEKKTDVTKIGNGNKLASFGNFHEIQPALIKDPKLSERLSTYMKSLGRTTIPGKQYYCSNVTQGQAVLKAKADPKECCLEIGFQGGDSNEIQKAMVQHYIYKMRFDRPYGSKDPAFRVQAFNGFTKLMGGAEGVSVFRSGVDYTKSPAYGYQAMDYILNNLESNPWLVREIEKQKKLLNLKEVPPSILCEGNPPGAFYIDSKHYFDLHRNSGRMTSILNKPYEQMTERQKKVINGEIDHMISKGMFPEEINGKKVPKIAPPSTQPLKYEVETSDGKKDEFQMTFGFGGQEGKNLSSFVTPEKIQKGFTYESDHLSYTLKPVGSEPLKVPVEYLASGFPPFPMLTPPYKIEYSSGAVMDVPDFTTTKCYGKDKKPIDCLNFDMAFKDLKATDSKGNGYEIKYSKLGEKFKTGGIYGVSASQSNKITFAGDNNWVSWKTPDQKKTENRGLPEASRAELVKYYFKELYKKRSTIEKASSYGSWNPISDEEIRSMGESGPNDNNGNGGWGGNGSVPGSVSGSGSGGGY